jgi:hypothetical protein
MYAVPIRPFDSDTDSDIDSEHSNLALANETLFFVIEENSQVRGRAMKERQRTETEWS